MIKIDDMSQLSALHKAILAAKFATFPNGQYREITASPILAGISNDIYDEMCRTEEKKTKGMGAEWQSWRRVKDSRGFRGQWRIAVMTARRDNFFMSGSRDDKIKAAKCYLSPFTCTEEELGLFIDEVGRKPGEQSIEKLFAEHDFTGARLLGCSYSLDHESGGDARLVLMTKKGETCDIFFGGVRTYRVSFEGENDITAGIPELRKHTVSDGSLRKFDAQFANEKLKQHIVIEAETVDHFI